LGEKKGEKRTSKRLCKASSKGKKGMKSACAPVSTRGEEEVSPLCLRASGGEELVSLPQGGGKSSSTEKKGGEENFLGRKTATPREVNPKRKKGLRIAVAYPWGRGKQSEKETAKNQEGTEEVTFGKGGKEKRAKKKGMGLFLPREHRMARKKRQATSRIKKKGDRNSENEDRMKKTPGKTKKERTAF